MEHTKAFDDSEGGHLQAIGSSCPSIASVQEEFRDIDLDDEDAGSLLGEEANLGLEFDELLDENPPSDESESSESDEEDPELFENFVIVQTGKGKIHNNDDGTKRRRLNCSECPVGSFQVSHACQFHINEPMSGDL